jgi:hypothetical protein
VIARICIYLESEGVSQLAQSLLKLKDAIAKNAPRGSGIDLTVSNKISLFFYLSIYL